MSSIDPYKYELFDVISETHLETVISLHILSRNIIIELYVKFAKVDRSGPPLTSVVRNAGTEVQAESPTTQLCGGFSGFLQSDYYDIPRTSIGRHSLISGIDLNFEDQFQSGSSYTGGSLTYIGHQPEDYSSRHMDYRRIDNILLSTRVDEGMSNTVLEGDNKSADEEGDTGEEKGDANANEGCWHMCLATSASQDHLSLDLDIIVNIVLLMVKTSPRVKISVLIVNIRSQY
ncbi:hypothetical protein J1N35_011066 [Gossypium stocksii]|uniref:Uncharacterized protein n=1 Tax=Gossypium stocksii TaxID=47602 RepID=A0A9D3W3J4_9ROSI|nr:hypothetical protein J1N35_011066 [Gossypium stocksii]